LPSRNGTSLVATRFAWKKTPPIAQAAVVVWRIKGHVTTSRRGYLTKEVIDLPKAFVDKFNEAAAKPRVLWWASFVIVAVVVAGNVFNWILVFSIGAWP